jgi:urease beta subunit
MTMIFFRLNIEFEKEHSNGRMMANIHIKGTFNATIDIGCCIHYYVLSYLLVFSRDLTLGVFR